MEENKKNVDCINHDNVKSDKPENENEKKDEKQDEQDELIKEMTKKATTELLKIIKFRNETDKYVFDRLPLSDYEKEQLILKFLNK